MVPTSEWWYHGYGTNFSNERTCLSIDEDDTDTDFSRSKQQWRDPLRLSRSIDGNKDADKFNSEYKNNIPMKTSRQCVYAHAKQVWGNGQFQQANDDTDIKFSYKQTTMKRATICFRSLDGIRDADKFNS